MSKIEGPVLVRDVLDSDSLTVIQVYCGSTACMHSGKILLTRFLDAGATLDTPVPELRRWCRCGKCGSRQVTTRSTPYPRGVHGVPFRELDSPDSKTP